MRVIRTIAGTHGYAVGLRDATSRGLDLIAVPWADTASPPNVLAAEVSRAVGAFVPHTLIALTPPDAGRDTAPNPESKLHERRYAVCFEAHLHIDPSPLPPTPESGDTSAPADELATLRSQVATLQTEVATLRRDRIDLLDNLLRLEETVPDPQTAVDGTLAAIAKTEAQTPSITGTASGVATTAFLTQRSPLARCASCQKAWDDAQAEWDAGGAPQSPSAVCDHLTPTDVRYMKDGDIWRATRPDFINLQESDAGFGDTQEEAIADLLRAEASTAISRGLMAVARGIVKAFAD
jgi:hypothetical protein